MRLLHGLARTHASFHDPHLVSHAGLVPVVALTRRAGLGLLVVEHVGPGGPCGAHMPRVRSPNSAWLTCAAIAHDLLRAAGSLASLGYAKSPRRNLAPRPDRRRCPRRPAWTRPHHVVPVRRMLYLSEGWHREHEWMTLVRRSLRPARKWGLTGPDLVARCPLGPRWPPGPHARSACGTNRRRLLPRAHMRLCFRVSQRRAARCRIGYPSSSTGWK